jgi:hypothetical protein
VPVPVTANWSSTSSSDPFVAVTVKPAGGTGCAANYGADEANSRDVLTTGGKATGSATQNATFPDPGQFILCGYLQSSSGSATPYKTTGPVTLTVRAAKASIALAVPAQVDPGQTVTVTANVTAELHREVIVGVKPAGGRPCEPTWAQEDSESREVIDTGAQGTQAIQQAFTASTTNGLYLFCAYVVESGSDPSPEAVGSAQMQVGPTPCQRAQAALARAQKAVRVAEAAVTRYRKQVKRLAARHSGAARARSRYHSAVRKRAQARATLSVRQAAVSQACSAG